MYRIPIYKIRLVKDSTQRLPLKSITKPATAAELLAFYLKGQDREHLVAVMLDVRERVIGINTVSIGTLTSAIAHPREVFKAAILSNAHSIIIGHNHPSGDPTPSDQDVEVTADLVKAGRLLKIPVLDHIIVTDEGAFSSLAALGLMTTDTLSRYAVNAVPLRVARYDGK